MCCVASRRHSVQDQNLEAREEILGSREFCRDPGQFPGLIHTLHAHSLDRTREFSLRVSITRTRAATSTKAAG